MKKTANKSIIIISGLVLTIVALLKTAEAQDPVRLEAGAPSYAGHTISFYKYTDYLTRDTTVICQDTIADDGTFRCMFTTRQTTKIFTDLGPYRGFLFAEPGKTYQLSLPEREEKTQTQELNPFFSGIPLHLGITNTGQEGLNYKINQFSNLYEEVVNKNLNNIKGLSEKRDSVLMLLDTTINSDNSFFQDYKRYKIAGLKLPLGFSADKIKRTYFSGKPLLYHNPAYMEVFATLYEDYLKDLFSNHGNELFRVINGKKSYSLLDSLSRQDTLLKENNQLRELVLLQSLQKACHDQQYSPDAVNHILDTFPAYSKHHENIAIANTIRKINTPLTAGDQAPGFCLYDADSNRVCLDDLKGEYIYLGFCNSKNYGCIRDYKVLEALQKRHMKHFKTVIISNNSFDAMARYARHHDYPFIFLHYGNQENILKAYQVRSMPAYFFIDPEGRLSIIPAPPPTENLEQRIYQRMKADGNL